MSQKRYVAETLADLPDMEATLARSGLEFMQDVRDGKLAGPPIGALMGFWPTRVEEGKVIFTGTPEFKATNPMGTVHGGWYGTILDSCMACAVMTLVPKGSVYTTLEYKVNILRPIPLGTEVEAIGICQHAGRSTGIANGEIRGVCDGKLYATGSTTCIIMKMT
ncbi:PaaI family thioesterase [Lentibacter sp.]|uniref:PaaI family thioesterase n=1 Tax=Lentibacter sp. TaxID=2024994 RepID=UPI003F6C22B1